jgi:MFS family permease
MGYIADRSETRKWPFLSGLIALGAETGLLYAGTTIGLWVAGRLLQGAAAAVVWVAGISLMADSLGKDGLGQLSVT